MEIILYIFAFIVTCAAFLAGILALRFVDELIEDQSIIDAELNNHNHKDAPLGTPGMDAHIQQVGVEGIGRSGLHFFRPNSLSSQ